MAPEVVTDPITPPVEAPPAQSLTSHAKAFDPDAPQGPKAVDDGEPDADSTPSDPRDHAGRFVKPRHRAESQQASPKDVEAINALTRQLREVEEEIGIKKQPGESSRAFGLRRQLEIAQALKAFKKPAPEKVSTPPARPQPVPVPSSAAFAEPEPKLEDFADQADPYAAHLRAATAWDRRREAHEATAKAAQTQTAEQIKQADTDFVQWAKQTTEAHDTRFAAFMAAKPEARAVFEAAAKTDMELSPVMIVAYETHEQGPQMLLALASDPELVDTLLLQTANQRAFDDRHTQNPLVAVVQRRLLKAMQAAQAGTTGSAVPPQKITVAPRPLNPVRTVTPAPTEAVTREGSLIDHAKKFSRR